MVTSSGIEVFLDEDADEVVVGLGGRGKPTSISLKPIFTSASNMRRFRSGSMGSMRAWLPSRRSTEHQRGAFVSFLSGQVRSRSSSGTNGRYLSNGMRLRGRGRWRHLPLLTGLSTRVPAPHEPPGPFGLRRFGERGRRRSAATAK